MPTAAARSEGRGAEAQQLRSRCAAFMQQGRPVLQRLCFGTVLLPVVCTLQPQDMQLSHAATVCRVRMCRHQQVRNAPGLCCTATDSSLHQAPDAQLQATGKVPACSYRHTANTALCRRPWAEICVNLPPGQPQDSGTMRGQSNEPGVLLSVVATYLMHSLCCGGPRE